MLRNFIISAIRNIIRARVQSIIQVLSLSLGITVVILVGMYAYTELNYDKFNEKYDRIYRLEYGDNVSLPSAIGHRIKQNIPEVENVVRLFIDRTKEPLLYFRYYPSNDSANARTVSTGNYIRCDSTIFDIFSFNFIQGDPHNALKEPYSCVITKSQARRMFGNTDPVGLTLERINSLMKGWYTVTGIIDDIEHSHIDIDFLISLTTYDSSGYGVNKVPRGHPEYLNSIVWGRGMKTYMTLNEAADPVFVENRINEHFSYIFKDLSRNEDSKYFSMRPMKDIYFSDGLAGEAGYSKHGDLGQLRIMITIALFILILAIINYINLTTARASLRAKEIRVRKVTGSSIFLLISQFLVESVIVALISLLIALTMVQLLIPAFNQLASLEMNPELLLNGKTLIAYSLSIILLGIISGMYPALYLTGMNSVASLSEKRASEPGIIVFRRALLTFQFTLSIILIIGVFVISRQIQFMKTADLGFNKDKVITISHGSRFGSDHIKQQTFKQELLKSPDILGVAYSETELGNQAYERMVNIEFNGIIKNCNLINIDPDFMDVLGISFLEGHTFSYGLPRINSWDSLAAGQTFPIIINSSLARAFELDSPVGSLGKHINWERNLQVIGIIDDIHFFSLHQPIAPTAYWYIPPHFHKASVKISSNNISSTLRYIRNVFGDIYPDFVIEYSFLDETFNRQYLEDEITGKIIIVFAVIALLIGGLGLFGLSFFMAARKTKEIGIRKSLGATDLMVFILLSKEFIKWVTLSVIIACPLGWIIMNKWLQDFAYRTNMSAWIFILAIIFAYAISFITVAWHAWKTARTNPIEALRYE